VDKEIIPRRNDTFSGILEPDWGHLEVSLARGMEANRSDQSEKRVRRSFYRANTREVRIKKEAADRMMELFPTLSGLPRKLEMLLEYYEGEEGPDGILVKSKWVWCMKLPAQNMRKRSRRSSRR
jgi:hypothetical protein